MAGLEGTVKLPAFGTVKKKTAAGVGGGAVLFVLLIWYVRQRKTAKAASPGPATGTVTDPAGNTCAAINPATGYCPGTLEDQQALSGSAGALGAGAPADTSGAGSGLQGASGSPGGTVQGPAPPGPGNFASNAEWAQYAEAYLTGSAGGDPAAVSSAIGKYLTGQPVTTDQVAIIDEAIAYAGQPPQAGPGGDPPGINTTAGSTGSASSSAGSPGPGPGKTAAGAISNLQAYDRKPTSFTARWNPARGASQGYRYALTQLNHVQVAEGTTGATSAPFSGLHPGWTYNLGVQALPGGPGDNIHVSLPSK